jgi:hypothetical protein
MKMRIPITSIREQLDDMLNKGESVVGHSGIILLEKSKSTDHVDGINCVTYCFGRENIPKIKLFGEGANAFALHIGDSREVRRPHANDIVVYIGEDAGGSKEQTHIGRLVGNGRVKSKWGYGNVYLHDVECVPASYGTEVRFFRKD